MGSTLANNSSSPKHLEIVIKPPFWHLPKPILKSLGLPKKATYTPSEVAKALGDHIDVMRKRLLASIYPEPKLYKGKGHRRFTAREVLRMAEIKERIGLGFDLRVTK
ncbi:hypothetical protein [Desulfonatronospira thiodismutans]|uniref:hypothetical protein n=1 Tax=Desulfonatronospira thiodismutans TaxID=488939 RepID=UPI0011872041|nr:hypothetical protein [Desulfonatronospira thiodismutans]